MNVRRSSIHDVRRIDRPKQRSKCVLGETTNSQTRLVLQANKKLKKYPILGYTQAMHIISKPPLVAFWKRHADAKSPLQAWLRIMQNEDFADFNDVKATFGAADYVKPHTVFDIGGNKYRLITAIHYNVHKVYVRHVLTHAEYGIGKWRKQ